MGKKETTIETLVVGASYFGIGYALAHMDCLIIESAQMLGTDFHPYLRTADMSKISVSEAQTDLAMMLQELGIWKDGRMDVLKASPAIHKYVSEMEKRPRILLDARILTIEKVKEDGINTEPARYRVQYIDNEGIHFIYCSSILDTTVCRDTEPDKAVCLSKTLNLFTVSVADEFETKLKEVCPNCSFEEGMNSGEKIVRIPFAPEVKRLSAYEQMVELWKQAFPDGEEKILFVAEDFDCICEPIKDVTCMCQWNGGRFANPLTAFAKGMEYSLI